MSIGKHSGSHTAVHSAAKRSRGRAGEHTAYKQPAFKLPQKPKIKLNKKHIIIICTVLAVILMVLLSAMLANADNRKYKRYMAQAADGYAAEDYDTALSYLRKASAIDNKDECLMLMADCYNAQGNLDKAIEVLQKSDTENSEISKRLIQLQSEKAESLSDEKKTVAGQKYDAKTRTLKLNDLGLDDSGLFEVSELTNLERLSLSGNSISDISELTKLTALVSLNLSGNNVEDISSLTKLKGLKALVLDGNPVKELTAVLELKNLSVLSIKDINISSEQLEKLSLALPDCTILSGEQNSEIVTISIAGVSFSSDVDELDLSGKDIKNVSALSYCLNIKKLDISGNQVSDLYAIMNIPGLKELNMADNMVSDLRPLMGLTELESIDASGNKVTRTTALGTMENLLVLDLSDNPITDYSGLSNLENIRYLGLDNTGLKDENLDGLKELKSLVGLSIEENQELSGEAVDKLKLKLSNCVIKTSELVYSVRVGKEIVAGNAKELKLSGLGISDLSPLQSLNFLETIDLSSNDISNIYHIGVCPSSERITSLNLAGNKISDVSPLNSLKNLETLNLANNEISSVLNLMNMSNLKTLDLSGNPLTEEQIKNLRESIPNCEVIFE